MLKGAATLLLAAFAFNFVILSGAFMEPSNRLQITSSIQSEKMRGIFILHFGQNSVTPPSGSCRRFPTHT